MRRFFTDEIENGLAVISGDDAKHICRVLRLGADDALSICDGNGMEYEAKIVSADAERVVCSLGAMRISGAECQCHTTLFQCLPKGDKFETVVQKCTELGVSRIVPVLSRRCVVAPDERFTRRLERYRRVALEAAKQSRRALVPEVLPLCRVEEIDPAQFDLFLIAYEEESELTLKHALRASKTPQRAALFIGPEGGIDQTEAAGLLSRGALSVSLGARILRTETAGPAMLAQLLYEVEP